MSLLFQTNQHLRGALSLEYIVQNKSSRQSFLRFGNLSDIFFHFIFFFHRVRFYVKSIRLFSIDRNKVVWHTNWHELPVCYGSLV